METRKVKENNVLRIKETMTSLELLKEINEFRRFEYEYKLENGLKLSAVELRNGKPRELLHKDLLKNIRDEFEEEINERKISPVEYIDDKGEKRPMFILNFNQCRQIMARESKFVRKGLFEYITKLEKQNEELRIALINKSNSEWLETRKNGKLTRRNETDVIVKLILMAKEQGSENADKLYQVYSTLVNNLVGIKSRQRDKVDVRTLEQIRLLEDLISKIIDNGVKNEIYYKTIYKRAKEKGIKLINLLKIENNLLGENSEL